jgi:hypothetical protein
VACRRATNPVGWLFLGGAVHVLAGEYAVYGIVTSPDALPLPHAMAWLSSATFAIGPVIDFILIPLYFPDGRLGYMSLILAAASLVVRFLRSVGEESQQLKWFTYAAAFVPVWFLVNSPIQDAVPHLFTVMDSSHRRRSDRRRHRDPGSTA